MNQFSFSQILDGGPTIHTFAESRDVTRSKLRHQDMSITDSKTNVNYSTENKLRAAVEFNQKRTLADELNSLHMYDSSLLGKFRPSQINKMRKPLEADYKTISTVSGSKFSQKKVQSNSLMTRRRSVTRGTGRRGST